MFKQCGRRVSQCVALLKERSSLFCQEQDPAVARPECAGNPFSRFAALPAVFLLPAGRETWEC